MARTKLDERTPRIVALFGGRIVLGGAVGGPDALRRALRRGFPYAAFEGLAATLGVRPAQVAALIGVPPRTLARRRASGRLSALESDRLYRIGHALQIAVDTLGSAGTAAEWLRAANRALGGATPMSCLDTEPGTREVEELLGRVSHGIVS